MNAEKKTIPLHHGMIDDAEASCAQEYADNFGRPGYDDPSKMYISQRYDGYTEDDQGTWQLLFDGQMKYLAENASNVYLSGAETIKLKREQIPNLDIINENLWPITKWQSKAVPGYIPAKGFFACLSRREFPTTVVLRPRESIGYLPEPDIFHDIFGHVPLHADLTFGDFLQTYGAAALHTNDDSHTERLARLFWFTVEFGLIKEDGRLKVYGSGLISSPGESVHSLESDQVDRRPFDLDTVCDTTFEIDHYQPILYVLESFDQLRDAMNTYAERILNEPAGEKREVVTG